MVPDRVAGMKEKNTLWCPVRKKCIADRPEERIRLRVIEYLRACGYPLTAMQVEYMVGRAGRFDLAVFTPKGDIWLLIECKQDAPSKDSLQAVMRARLQLMRYARAIEKRWRVHYLGIVIGERFYCLEHSTGRWLQGIPSYPAL